jgi:hypothetical protein
MISRDGRIVILLFALLFPVLAFAQPGPRNAPGLDGVFVGLAHQVPGFGGYFFDANGDLNVFLTDLAKEPAARAVLADVARNRPEHAQQPWTQPAKIVVRRADFDFPQLQGWKARFVASPAVDGVHVLDVDETTNRVFIGVADNAAVARVQARLDALGIPRGAVTVAVTKPAELVTNLQQYYRPLIGGLQVDSNTTCTLGVNVLYTNFGQGISTGTPGFYTAAHCSTTRFGTDGTVFSQGGSQIGHEAWDPPTFTSAWTSACPVGSSCRWSDVAFVQYDSGVSAHQGYIAQTAWRGFGGFQSGSLDINTEYSLPSTTLPVVGNYLDKVGRTTGWTSGQVISTCRDWFVGGYWVLCQDNVLAYADFGDSGSPVFSEQTQTTAGFSGIVWAKDTSNGSFIFSNLDRIAADMGGYVTYGPN